MTVPKIDPVNNYAGNGSTTTFDFDFLIESTSELLVQHTNNIGVQTTLVYDTDYTINAIGNENGSYITFPKAGSTYSTLESDEILSITPNLDIKQEKEIKNSGKLNLAVMEWCLDYITRILQVHSRKIERSIKVQESTNIDTETLVNNINNVAAGLSTIEAVNANSTNINTVAANGTDISTCATNISSINSASTNATNAANSATEAANSAIDAGTAEDNASIWSEGTDEQVQTLGGTHSAKEWAEISSQGQVQADFNQADNTAKDFIKNKPVIIDFTVSLDTTWAGATAPFTQTVSVGNILATDTPVIGLIKSSTWATAEEEIAEYSKIKKAETGEGTITFYAEEATSINLTLQGKLIR